MDSKEVYDSIIVDGGIIYNMRTLEKVTKGYAVSIYKEREIRVPVSVFSRENIEKYVSNNIDLFTQDGNTMLGAWKQGEMMFIDVTIVTSNKMEALDLARRNNQIAIFDLETFEEIKA